MEIKILGGGCPKCKKLEELVKAAVAELGLEAKIGKVTDVNDIVNYGVMITPALVVDGEVKLAGRLPSPDQLKKLLQGK